MNNIKDNASPDGMAIDPKRSRKPLWVFLAIVGAGPVRRTVHQAAARSSGRLGLRIRSARCVQHPRSRGRRGEVSHLGRYGRKGPSRTERKTAGYGPSPVPSP